MKQDPYPSTYRAKAVGLENLLNEYRAIFTFLESERWTWDGTKLSVRDKLIGGGNFRNCVLTAIRDIEAADHEAT